MAEDYIQIYLRPTALIDSDHPAVQACARAILGDTADPVEQAVKLYLSVRDGIRYDPYSPFHLPEHYQASKVLERRRSFCIPKAAVLCALGRASGIPTRIGFADVRNHLATKQLLDYLGSNLFVYHGFVELFLEGKWVKATPAFNRELCERHHVPPMEFNGREDSLFQPYNPANRKYMEYVAHHGTYADIPVAEILAAWRRAYGEERIEGWIRMSGECGTEVGRDFGREDVCRE
jgi:transglutaminase-like putative cysteine protease